MSIIYETAKTIGESGLVSYLQQDWNATKKDISHGQEYKRKKHNKELARTLAEKVETVFDPGPHGVSLPCFLEGTVAAGLKELYHNNEWFCVGFSLEYSITGLGRRVTTPDQKITEKFIYACLEDGLGIENNEGKQIMAMATGLALSYRDWCRAAAQMFAPYPSEETDKAIIDKELVQIALTLARYDEKQGSSHSYCCYLYYSELVRCYTRMVDKISKNKC